MGGRLGSHMRGPESISQLRKSEDNDDPIDEEMKESEVKEQYNLDDDSDGEGVNKIMQGALSNGVYQTKQ